MWTSNWTRALMALDPLKRNLTLPKRNTKPMTDEQEAHLARLKAQLAADLDAKYRDGQAHHGGDLWTKPGLLEAAIEEALDQLTYLYTLREQRDRGRYPNGRDT